MIFLFWNRYSKIDFQLVQNNYSPRVFWNMIFMFWNRYSKIDFLITYRKWQDKFGFMFRKGRSEKMKLIRFLRIIYKFIIILFIIININIANWDKEWHTRTWSRPCFRNREKFDLNPTLLNKDYAHQSRSKVKQIITSLVFIVMSIDKYYKRIVTLSPINNNYNETN